LPISEGMLLSITDWQQRTCNYQSRPATRRSLWGRTKLGSEDCILKTSGNSAWLPLWYDYDSS